MRYAKLMFGGWFLFASTQPADAYSYLTHEVLIDQSWQSSIVPILLNRFPSLTPDQLRNAHAYAYGGCAIQDLGYYPFGEELFSDLTHYVRSGDFVLNLFRNATTADELAFAIGALSHYIGDSIGHSRATNPAVALTFPKLRAEYGPSVNYAQSKNSHGQVEFAFDVDQIVNRRSAPRAYLHHIGLKVPRRQLASAFYETYGLHIQEVLGAHEEAVRTYHFGARSFLPAFADAEAVLHRRSFPIDSPNAELDQYIQRMSQLSREEDWDHYRKAPGFGTHMLAVLVVIVPKAGPAKMLAIKGPTVETEKSYIASVNACHAALEQVLKNLSTAETVASQSLSFRIVPDWNLVPNRDLDTGARVLPGGYRLTDETYAQLLAKVTSDPAKPVPQGLKRDILDYYADPDAPISTKKNSKHWAKVQQQLQLLDKVPVSVELLQ
jgi:hypothetical protein